MLYTHSYASYTHFSYSPSLPILTRTITKHRSSATEQKEKQNEIHINIRKIQTINKAKLKCLLRPYCILVHKMDVTNSNASDRVNKKKFKSPTFNTNVNRFSIEIYFIWFGVLIFATETIVGMYNRIFTG